MADPISPQVQLEKTYNAAALQPIITITLVLR
jgi:hypothetical protein